MGVLNVSMLRYNYVLFTRNFAQSRDKRGIGIYGSLSIEQLIFVTQCHNFLDNVTDELAILHFVLILLSGDVHPHAGPTDQFGDLNICHANIRSLTNDKLMCIKSSLAQSFDLITLSETFLSPDKNS